MTMHLETEITSSRFDPLTQTCFYTIERSGKRWTAAVKMAELNVYKTKMQRRTHIANALTVAMQGKPDAETMPGEANDHA